MLAVTALNKTYSEAGKQHSVLVNVEFTLEKGKSASIVGASGSGKSTLLHVIATLDQADSGHIYFDTDTTCPIDLCKLTETQADQFRKSKLGIVFQRFNLIDCISVLDNISLPAKLNNNFDSHFIESLMSQLGIAHLAKKLPIDLSGGEQQRVAIARALSHRPKLVLADEPTGNLDSATSESVSRLLFETCKEAQAGLIVVTHSEKVARLADKEWLLESGQLNSSVLADK